MLSVSLYCYFIITKLVSLRRKFPPRLRCEYNVPRCYVKCKYFFHGFAINFFRFVTYLNPKFSQIQHYVNQLRYFLPFFAVSVTFSSIPFGLTSEFLSFVRNHLLHFLIVTYKTLALYLCSHGFQNFFAFFPQGRAFGPCVPHASAGNAAYHYIKTEPRFCGSVRLSKKWFHRKAPLCKGSCQRS